MTTIVGLTVSLKQLLRLKKNKLGSRSSAKTATMRLFHHVLLQASKSESLKPLLMNTLAGFTMLEFTVSHSIITRKIRLYYFKVAQAVFALPILLFAVQPEFPSTVSTSSSVQALSVLMELASQKK